MIGAGFPTAAEWAHLKKKGRTWYVAEKALYAATLNFGGCIVGAFFAGNSVNSMPPIMWKFVAATTVAVTVIRAVKAFRRWSFAEGIATLRESVHSGGETAHPPASTSIS